MDDYPEPYENLTAQILQQEKEVTMKGWMKKKAGHEKFTFSATGNYDKRYFIILKGWVYYYKETTSQKPQGCFSLQGYSSRIIAAEEERSQALPFVFKIFPQSGVGRTWYFAPDSKFAMDEWIAAFKREIEKYNNNMGNSSLRVSVSLPEKLRPNRRPTDSLVNRPRSMNNKPINRRGGKNSVESSCHTSSRGSMSSMMSEDYEDAGNYEPVDIQPEPIPEENYVDVNEINSPADFLPPRSPAGSWGAHGRMPMPGVPLRIDVPLPPIPQSTFSPPLPPRDNTSELSVPVYDTIDESQLPPEQNSFDFRSLPPLPNPGAKPQFQFPLSGKEPICRVDSFPLERPPKPPTQTPQSGYYDTPDTSIERTRGFSYCDKPLPPLPPEETRNEEEAMNFQGSGRSSPELYSNVCEDEPVNVSRTSEDNIEQTYEDTVVTEGDFNNQFHHSSELTGDKYRSNIIPIFPSAENKPQPLSPKVPQWPSSSKPSFKPALKPIATTKPAPPLKPATPLKPPTPLKPGTSSKPPTPLKLGTSPKPAIPFKPTTPQKPSVPLKPKHSPDNHLTQNRFANSPTDPNAAIPVNKFWSNLTVESSPNSREPDSRKPQSFAHTSPTSGSSTTTTPLHETHSPSGQMAAILLKNVSKRGASQTSSHSASPRTGIGSQSSDSQHADPSSASVQAKTKMFGERVVGAEPTNDPPGVSAKAKMFQENTTVMGGKPPVSSKPKAARKPYPR